MTLFVVYKWDLTFGYVDRESCVKEAWQGNVRGRREKKKKRMRTKQRIGNEATDRPGVQVRVLLFLFSFFIFPFPFFIFLFPVLVVSAPFLGSNIPVFGSSKI